MRAGFSGLTPCCTATAVITTAIAGNAPVVAPAPPSAQAGLFRPIRLAGSDPADAPLGGGTALIIGGSGIPTPGQGYLDLALDKYLAPLGFTGTMRPVTTPESLYPFTGPFSETINDSGAKGVQDIIAAVQQQIDAGGVTPQNPVVLFGYSQGSWLLGQMQTQLAQQLATQDVPSDDIHIVMVGDTGAPNGGLLQRFDLPNGTEPTAPSVGLTFTQGQPSDLFPTDVYTLEYDGWADFPRYPLDLLADANAFSGMLLKHLAYYGLPSDRIADAIALPTSDTDTLTNYYMIASSLPLLDPLRLVPFAGDPLADLLEPDLRVLVDLGYGSVTQGWDPGDADAQTPLGFLPSLSVLEQVPGALANGLVDGIEAAAADLAAPQNYTYTLPEWVNELVASLPAIMGNPKAGGEAVAGDPTNVFNGVPRVADSDNVFVDILNDFAKAGFPEHTGIPQIDMATAALISVPLYDLSITADELANHHFIDAIGVPLAADVGLLPLFLFGSL